MALRQCAIVALRNGLGGRQQVAAASSLAKIGNRDVVGYGVNGAPNYYDRVDFPMPAVRFKENTPDVMVRQCGFYSLLSATVLYFLGVIQCRWLDYLSFSICSKIYKCLYLWLRQLFINQH